MERDIASHEGEAIGDYHRRPGSSCRYVSPLPLSFKSEMTSARHEYQLREEMGHKKASKEESTTVTRYIDDWSQSGRFEQLYPSNDSLPQERGVGELRNIRTDT